MKFWYSDLEESKRRDVKRQLAEAKNSDAKAKIIFHHHPKGHCNLRPVKNLEEYFRYVRLTTTTQTWFRGESREHDSFIPKLFRNIKQDQINEQLDKEKHYIAEFKRKAKSIISNLDSNDNWSWYFLAQHYGAPTRLFDWTADAAVALFMALDTSRERKDNPVVYTLAPTVLTSYAFKEIGKELKAAPHVLYPGDDGSNRWIANITGSGEEIPETPIALLPPHSDPRIVAQRSCFTLFGRRTNGFYKDAEEIVCDCCSQRIRHKIVIDGTKKIQLRNELFKIGVTSGRIYPGLEGLAKEINQDIYDRS